MEYGDFRERLRTAVAASDKSLRAISLAAGAGPGYLHSILEEGKSPSVDRLMKVCDAIPVSPAYIMLGIDAKPEDMTILELLHKNPDARDGILRILGAASS